jgi:hypothetical protein
VEKNKLQNSVVFQNSAELIEEKSTSVNVGKGGVHVDAGKGKPGGTSVNVGGKGGGVDVHAGKGKPGGTSVHVGKGGVGVDTGKGKRFLNYQQQSSQPISLQQASTQLDSYQQPSNMLGSLQQPNQLVSNQQQPISQQLGAFQQPGKVAPFSMQQQIKSDPGNMLALSDDI